MKDQPAVALAVAVAVAVVLAVAVAVAVVQLPVRDHVRPARDKKTILNGAKIKKTRLG